jgi:hypothetical protein
MRRTDLLPETSFDNHPMQGLHLTADLRDCHGDAALMTETSALKLQT